MLAPLLALAVLAAGCSGSSDTPQESASTSESGEDVTGEDVTGENGSGETATETSEVDETVTPTITGLVFVNPDGSAFAGSRTVFTLTDADSGTTIQVPVDGAAEETAQAVTVAPGTYRVSGDQPHISPTASYTVRDLGPTEVTITADAPVARVAFGLDVQQTPLDLRLASMTSSTVELSWEVLTGIEISGYELIRTAGSLAATTPGDGTPIELSDRRVTTASAGGLEPATEYTFTLFATTNSGEAISRGVSVVTASLDASVPAYALAPNAIVPTDFAALNAEAVGDQRVRIDLDPANGNRSSATDMPGIEPSVLDSGCAVGMPVLVSTDVAGEDSFFGLIDACEGQSGVQSLLATSSARSTLSAIVNTDVPLAAVIPYLKFRSSQNHPCIDITGQEIAPDATLCRSQDSDGDGTGDLAEFATEEFGAPEPGAVPTTPTTAELEPSAAVSGGLVQVTLLWATGDDLDLHVTDPTGDELFYGKATVASGGLLDTVDHGDSGCQSTAPRTENAHWESAAPPGTYTVRATNWAGTDQTQRAVCSPAPEARLQVRIGGALIIDETITVGVDLPITFVVPPPGEVQVMVTWASGDDLHLSIAPPGVSAMNFYSTSQNFQGAQDQDTYYSFSDRGDPFCQSAQTRSEYLVWDSARDPDHSIVGQWVVGVTNDFSFAEEINDRRVACSSDPVEAHLVVLVRGDVVLDRTISICDCGDGVDIVDFSEQIPFVVDPGSEPSDLRRQFSSILAVPDGTARPGKAGVTLECEADGDAALDLGFGFGKFFNGGAELNIDSFTWDFDAGVTVYVEPAVSIEGAYECEFDIPGVTFQLLHKPVPLNLEVQPKLGGGVTGSFELSGPRLELAFGFATDGHVNEEVEWCGWFDMIPCGIGYTSEINAEPIATFTHGPAQAKLEAELTVSAGIEATLGVGVKNKFVTAKTGFAFDMRPVSETLTAAVAVGADLPDPTTTTTTTTTVPPNNPVPDRQLRCAAERRADRARRRRGGH